jgi:hypothetical protein
MGYAAVISPAILQAGITMAWDAQVVRRDSRATVGTAGGLQLRAASRVDARSVEENKRLDGEQFDGLARRLVGAVNRRQLLGGLGVALFASATTGTGVAGAKPGKNERERCKKKAQKCKRQAAAFCAFNWPGLFESCAYDLNQCCALRSECKVGSAKRCYEISNWTR